MNVGPQSEVTLDLLHQFERGILFDMEAVSLGPRVIIVLGLDSADFHGHWRRHLVVLDVHTRVQFKATSFDAVWEDIHATGVRHFVQHSIPVS